MSFEVIKYRHDDFTKLPRIINSRIDDKAAGDFFCVALDGQEVTEKTYGIYHDLMCKFELGFAFYPYSEAMISVNRVFGNPNPLIEITLFDGSKIDAVRQINYAVMFFDISRLDGMKLDERLEYAFMEKFSDSIASIGAIPSNGMFIDLHNSWNYFSKYRRGQLEYNLKFNQEFNSLGMTLDNDTSKLIKHVAKIQEKLGLATPNNRMM